MNLARSEFWGTKSMFTFKHTLCDDFSVEGILALFSDEDFLCGRTVLFNVNALGWIRYGKTF